MGIYPIVPIPMKGIPLDWQRGWPSSVTLIPASTGVLIESSLDFRPCRVIVPVIRSSTTFRLRRERHLQLAVMWDCTTRTGGYSSWRNSAKGSRSARRLGDAGSIRKPPFCGDTGFWPCRPV